MSTAPTKRDVKTMPPRSGYPAVLRSKQLVQKEISA